MIPSNQWKVFGVLAACLLGLIVLRAADDRTPRRMPLTYVSGQTVKPDRAASSPILANLISSERDAVLAARTPSKNIFAPLTFPKPKRKQVVAKVKPPPPPPPKPAAPPPPPGPSAEEFAAAEARKQMAQYRALGFSEDGGTPRAFLGKGTKIYIAQVGEELEERIVVAAITADSVRLRETRTRLEATLPLRPAGAAPSR